MRVLRLGDHGSAVAEIRAYLTELGLLADDSSLHTADAIFDAATDQAVRAFQQERRLLVDGIVGPETYQVLRAASYRLGSRVLSYQLSAPMTGDDIAELQTRLLNLGFYTGLADGKYGELTYSALQQFQSDFGLTPDGICGPKTLRSLELLGTRVTGGSPHRIREVERVRDSGPQLTGKRIVIDPGSGSDDMSAADAELASSIMWDLASLLEGKMAAAGMETYLSRAAGQSPTDAERARTANSFDADLMISLRCATYSNPAAHGVATFAFGNSHGSHSTIGRSLAGFVQREIVARTPLQDCRSHERTWEILRLTQMPTVQIDLGYLSNFGDSAILSDPHQRDTIAYAILVAVKRLYLLGKNDQPTGTYTFAELLAAEQNSLAR